MRRADRLFQIIQILRRSTRPVTAAHIAEELEVSRRTIYRDIPDLVGQRVPIVGEAGLGSPQCVRGRGAFMLWHVRKGTKNRGGAAASSHVTISVS